MDAEKLKRYGVPALIVVILLAAVASYLQSRDDRIRMDATMAAQNQLLSKYAEQIKGLDDRMAERDRQMQQQLAVYASIVQRVQTPAQVIREIPQYLPQLPVQPQVTEDASGKKQVVIPEADLKPLFDFSVRCKACEAELSAAKSNLADLQSKVDAQQEQLKATEKQRDAAVKAARGGGFWRRTGRALKYVGIGIGIGIAVGRL